jgi:hypothetical protein
MVCARLLNYTASHPGWRLYLHVTFVSRASSELTAHSSTFLTASPNLKDSRMSSVWDRATRQSVIGVITTYSHEITGFPLKLANCGYTSMPQCQMLFIHSTTLCPIGRNVYVYLQFSFRSCANRTSVQYARSHLAASHVHSSVRKPTLREWPDIISLLLTLWWHHFLRIRRSYFNERNDCETKNTQYTTPSAHHRHAG